MNIPKAMPSSMPEPWPARASEMSHLVTTPASADFPAPAEAPPET
ncbi:MAG TPA: hypothetical protein VOA87_21200 [Thermoanaerobaculia bacterium]|nr:hypothetical protein [Thermoanaerobaculia bacterium]